jgi:hypothetical protein
LKMAITELYCSKSFRNTGFWLLTSPVKTLYIILFY